MRRGAGKAVSQDGARLQLDSRLHFTQLHGFSLYRHLGGTVRFHILIFPNPDLDGSIDLLHDSPFVIGPVVSRVAEAVSAVCVARALVSRKDDVL